MYFSYQGLKAIHQEVVSDGLRRSQRRRLLKSSSEGEGSGAVPRRRIPIARLLGERAGALAARGPLSGAGPGVGPRA